MVEEISKNSHQERLRYLVFLHNIMNFKNELFDDSDEMYRNIIENKINSIEEPYLDSALNNLKIIGDSHLYEQGIYCAFHFGCYRLVSRYLYSNGIKHTIILNILNEDEELKFSDKIKIANNGTNIVDYVNIVRRRDIIKLKTHLSEGRNLLIYADANLNALDFDNNSTERITFMNKEINVMKGVWYFSNKFNLPIHPVISLREQGGSILKFEDELKPSDHSKETLQEIWKLLELYINRHPNQWEGWLFANNFNSVLEQKGNGCSIKDYYKFNKKRYRFYNYPLDKFSLYDIINNQLIQLNGTLYEVILKISQKELSIEKKVLSKIIPEQIFTDLTKKEVFI